MKVQPARFWRRLAAAWIDFAILYSLSNGLVAAMGLLGVRASLELIALIAGCLYGTLFLWAWSATPGKALLGLEVQPNRADALDFRTSFLREAVGKWGLTVLLPIWCCRRLLGGYWVESAFDLVVVLLVLLFLLIYYRLARGTWWDQLSRTAVVRQPGHSLRRLQASLGTVVAAAVIGAGMAAAGYFHKGWIPSNLALFHGTRSTGPYTAFLKQPHARPVDYVMGLFDRYDVVVLCERAHTEFTQWEFIYDLVSDRRFIDKVGTIFTEYGQRNAQPALDRFMATPGLSDAEVAANARQLMRTISLWPYWSNTNIYQYLQKLYRLNQTLAEGKRVRHYFAEIEMDWDKIRSRRDLLPLLVKRDKIMSDLIAGKLRTLWASEPGRKCLVVMNYRHAFGPIRNASGKLEANVGGYLYETFPGRTANVLLVPLIPLIPLPATPVLAPVQGGVWDAAFQETGNRPAGFDFAGSPFGTDRFDLYPFKPSIAAKCRYQDVFTGYVFDRPLNEQFVEIGIPGLYDGVEEQIVERTRLIKGDSESYVRERLREAAVQRRAMMYHQRSQTMVEAFFLTLAAAGLVIAASAFFRSRAAAATPSRSSSA